MENLIIEKPLFRFTPSDKAVVNSTPMGEGFEWVAEEVLVIIVKVNSLEGKEESFNLELAGKKMFEWVKLATAGPKQKFVFASNGDNILDVIRPHLGDEKYTAVLYSDTPLLERGTFLRILEYMRLRDGNVLRLLRGYVFNTAYAKSAHEIYSSVLEEFEKDNFLEVNSGSAFCEASERLFARIRKYHALHGVLFADGNSVFIGPDVIIESGVTIGPSNLITGETYIGKNVRIGFGNVICNSIISEGTEAEQSSIYRYKSSAGELIFSAVKGSK